MKAKKLVGLIALLAAVLTAAAGCGGNTEPVSSAPGASTQSTASAQTGAPQETGGAPVSGETTAPSQSGPAATTKTKAQTVQTTKANGFIIGSGNGTGVTSPNADIPGLPPLSSKVTNKTVRYLTHVYPDSSNKNITNLLISQYGLTIKHITVPYDSKLTRLIQMIAAGDSPDLIGMDEGYLTLLANNLAQSAEPYVDFSDKIWDDVRSLQEARKWKGEVYEVISHAVPSRMFFYNPKMFQQQGLQTPLYYYDKGEWDWDCMIDLAKKLTLDLNNDGITDQWGFGGESLEFMVMGAVNESFIKVDASGSVQNNLRSTNLAKAMNMLSDIQLKEKIYAPEASFNKLMNNQMAMGYYGAWNIETVSGAADRVKAGQLAFVPAPSAPGMKNYNFPLYESSFIPVGAKNPYGAAAYLTYMHYAENVERDNTIWSKDMLRVYDDACKNLMTSVTNRDVQSVSSIEWSVAGELRQGKSWSSVLETYSPKLDAAIAQLPKTK